MIATLALMMFSISGTRQLEPQWIRPDKYQLITKLNKRSFAPSESISMTCDFSNKTNADVIFWERSFDCNHRIRVLNEAGEEPALTRAGKESRKWFSPNGGPSKTLPVLVPAGKSYRTFGAEGEPNDLTAYFILPPGKYWLVVEHIENREPAMRLSSPTVQFEVRRQRAR